MGFRYMDCLNDAMLMKQLWRMLCVPESLLSVVMRYKYFREGNVLLGKAKQCDSFAWKSMVGTLEIFSSGLIQEEGIWYCKLSSSRVYTVKSGYDLATRWKLAKERDAGETSNWESKRESGNGYGR